MSSMVFRTAVRLILPLTFLFGAYMGLKGHNEPGGGFVAGLIFAVAFMLYMMSDGPEAYRRLVPVHPRMIIFIGLVFALATALVPMALGYPFLTSHVRDIVLPSGESIHFSSVLFFDIGVTLVVVGVAVGAMQRLSEELEP